MPANMYSVTEFSKKIGALKGTPYFGEQIISIHTLHAYFPI
jgi:hypothetical protein